MANVWLKFSCSQKRIENMISYLIVLFHFVLVVGCRMCGDVVHSFWFMPFFAFKGVIAVVASAGIAATIMHSIFFLCQRERNTNFNSQSTYCERKKCIWRNRYCKLSNGLLTLVCNSDIEWDARSALRLEPKTQHLCHDPVYTSDSIIVSSSSPAVYLMRCAIVAVCLRWAYESRWCRRAKRT